jgi:hypothetical protein
MCLYLIPHHVGSVKHEKTTRRIYAAGDMAKWHSSRKPNANSKLYLIVLPYLRYHASALRRRTPACAKV